MTDQDPRLLPGAVRERYDDPDWFNTTNDKWHKVTFDTIRREVADALKAHQGADNSTILNIGSGSNDFGFAGSSIINVDISGKRISHLKHPVVANAEMLPFPDGAGDVVICVGSVINYCDAARLIAELARVTRMSGTLIVEFESSYSAELRKQSVYGQTAAVAETFYAERPEPLWVYSPNFIRGLLRAAGLEVSRSMPIHIVSPWALLLFGDSNRAAAMASIDPLARNFPVLSHWASNHLVFCTKQTWPGR